MIAVVTQKCECVQLNAIELYALKWSKWYICVKCILLLLEKDYRT